MKRQFAQCGHVLIDVPVEDVNAADAGCIARCVGSAKGDERGGTLSEVSPTLCARRLRACLARKRYDVAWRAARRRGRAPLCRPRWTCDRLEGSDTAHARQRLALLLLAALGLSRRAVRCGRGLQQRGLSAVAGHTAQPSGGRVLRERDAGPWLPRVPACAARVLDPHQRGMDRLTDKHERWRSPQ